MGLAKLFQKIRKANRVRLARRRVIKDCLAKEFVLERAGSSPFQVRLGKAASRAFHFRADSEGDRGVVQQMFICRDYDLGLWEQGRRLLSLASKLASAGIEALIIDAGANIGGAAVFFQQIIPNSKLICIEPDPANCRLCLKNIEGFNALLLEKAISSVSGEVLLYDPGQGDWGFRTGAPADEREGLIIQSINIEKILELYAGGAEYLIVKIDIEGAESDLFLTNCEWMDIFPCVIIELHDWMLPGEGTSLNFFKQIASRKFDYIQRGENIFLFNMALIEEKIHAHL